jgi:hypothetical protein
MTFDPFFAEQRGRERREQLLAEAAHERLLRQARTAAAPGGHLLPGMGAAFAVVATRADGAARGAVGLAGLALVAMGTRLQRVALGSVDPCDLEPAAW